MFDLKFYNMIDIYLYNFLTPINRTYKSISETRSLSKDRCSIKYEMNSKKEINDLDPDVNKHKVDYIFNYIIYFNLEREFNRVYDLYHNNKNLNNSYEF